MPKGKGYKKGSDRGFFGHYDVPKKDVVKNPSTQMSKGKDGFMGKVGNNNILGKVGSAGPISGKGI